MSDVKYKGWLVIQMGDNYWIGHKHLNGQMYKLGAETKAKLKERIDKYERASSIWI